jgi:hypothetical protein
MHLKPTAVVAQFNLESIATVAPVHRRHVAFAILQSSVMGSYVRHATIGATSALGAVAGQFHSTTLRNRNFARIAFRVALGA